jgi:predicted nuclease of predicted toxin-antitoxin system
MRFLIDECLHTSLTAVANSAGFEADHVVYRGLGGSTDAEVLAYAIQHDFVLVTNNAVDFRKLYKREKLHPGLIIFIPQLEPAKQRTIFTAVLKFTTQNEPINEVIEATINRGKVTLKRLPLSR